MTICVAIRVNECIVFAADSATTLSIRLPTGQEQTLVFRHGHKVFNLHKALPVCAMTYGTGNIGRASVSMLAKDFRALITSGPAAWKIDQKTYTIEEIATKFQRFLYQERFQALNPTPTWSQPMGLYVGGYSGTSDMHEVWSFTIDVYGQSAAAICVARDGVCGLNVGGDTEAFQRLAFGFAPSVANSLVGILGDPATAAQAIATIRQSSERSLVWDAMPVQDAIDFADYLVDVTKGFVRFLPGHDTVGGDTDIAVVTKHEGFKWVRRKHYYPAELNLGATHGEDTSPAARAQKRTTGKRGAATS